jgi:hypothetical protein
MIRKGFFFCTEVSERQPSILRVDKKGNLLFESCMLFLGDSPASEFYMPTFRKTLFHLHKQVGVTMTGFEKCWAIRKGKGLKSRVFFERKYLFPIPKDGQISEANTVRLTF